MINCSYCGAESKLKHKNMSHPVWKEMVNIDMYECLCCKSLTTFPMPSQEHLAFCYGKYSFDGFPESKSKAKKSSNQNVWYNEILKIFNFSRKNDFSIADVGAGEGLLEEALIDMGFKGNIDCYDYHAMPGKIKSLNESGFSIAWNVVDFSNKDWMPESKFDSVFCISVIEHVPDPVKLVNDLIRMVKSGGEICIIGPCVDTVFYSILKEKWVYMIPGEHLSMPSIKGLEKMMGNMKVAGFTARKIPVSYSVKYILDSVFKVNSPSIFDQVLRLPVGAFALRIVK